MKSDITNTINEKYVLLFLAAASAAILGGALIGQYGFDLYPCDLCIYQRWPHGVVIAIGLVSGLLTTSTKAQQYAIVTCCMALLAGAGIAFYHTGVEVGWFQGPDACSASTEGELSLEELRAQIKGAALVSCKQAMAYIFGLSMAAWNMLASVGLVATVLQFKFHCEGISIRNKNGSISVISIIHTCMILLPSILWMMVVVILSVIFTPIIWIYSIWFEGDKKISELNYLQRITKNYEMFFKSPLDIIARNGVWW